MLIGSITNLLDSTSAAQQSINLFLLCSVFYCLQVAIPNLYHSLQALDSLLLPSSFPVDNCQKKKKSMTLAKNPLNCPPFDLHCIHSSHLPSCSRPTTVSDASFPKVYTPSSELTCNFSHLFQSYQSHLPFLLSVFLFHSIAFFLTCLGYALKTPPNCE